MIIGIGAKPAVSSFEGVGLNTTVGGIQVHISSNSNCFFYAHVVKCIMEFNLVLFVVP